VPIGFVGPTMPVLKTPPAGFTVMLNGCEVLHKFGTAVIVGVGGFTAVIVIVLVVGQFTKLGVTVTKIVCVLVVPTDTTGVIIVDE
jgi:predicted amino acid dehydrogenase